MRLLIFVFGALVGGLAYQQVNRRKVRKLIESALDSMSKSNQAVIAYQEQFKRDIEELDERHLDVRADELRELRDRLRELLDERSFSIVRQVFNESPAMMDPEEAN